MEEVGGEVEEELVKADWEGLRLRHKELLPEADMAEEDNLLCRRPERVLPSEVGLVELVHPRYCRLEQQPLADGIEEVIEGAVDHPVVDEEAQREESPLLRRPQAE